MLATDKKPLIFVKNKIFTLFSCECYIYKLSLKCCNEATNIKTLIMTNLAKIQTVVTSEEISLIELDFRMFIDDYNNQGLDSYKTLISMFDSITRNVLQKIQSETHLKYGASGMVLVSQILPALGLKTNHKILD